VVRDHRHRDSNGKACRYTVGDPASYDQYLRCTHPRRRPTRNPRCNKRNTSGCETRDHRKPPEPQCYGNLC
jgi:hypothetical protein